MVLTRELTIPLFLLVYFTILHGLNAATGNAIEGEEICEECLNLFCFFHGLEKQMMELGALTSTAEVVRECGEKAKLFLGHRIRVINQQRAIRKTLNDIRDRCMENRTISEAVVTLDYNMKLEPLYYREKTSDHYGKRGMSWHGAMVQYFVPTDSADEFGHSVQERKLYYDHISLGDNRQDRNAAVSVLEAVLIRLRSDIPTVNKIVLLSDNANCYQNALLPLVAPYLSVAHGILIAKILHTETQDGKSVLDAHFARSMQVIQSWVKLGNDCIFPTQAAIGLKAHSGLPNCMVELIEHDRDRLGCILKELEVWEKKVRASVSRANEIVIEIPSMAISSWPDANPSYADCPPFSLRFYEYSNIGEGILFELDPQASEVQPNGIEEGIGDGSDDDVFGDGKDISQDEEAVVSGAEGLDDAESDSTACSTWESDYISTRVTLGPVTGVKVSTQGQLRKRNRRTHATTTPPDINGTDIVSRDAVSTAIKTAIQMQDQGKIDIRDARIDNGLTEAFSRSQNSPTFVLPWEVSSGWATRPKRGQTYGKRHISQFQTDIATLFSAGEDSQSQRMGPGRMLEELRKTYPDLFDLPSEIEIRQEISRLMRRGRESTSGDTPNDEILFLESLVEENVGIKPKEAMVRLHQAFADPQLSDNQAKYRQLYQERCVRVKFQDGNMAAQRRGGEASDLFELMTQGSAELHVSLVAAVIAEGQPQIEVRFVHTSISAKSSCRTTWKCRNSCRLSLSDQEEYPAGVSARRHVVVRSILCSVLNPGMLTYWLSYRIGLLAGEYVFLFLWCLVLD